MNNNAPPPKKKIKNKRWKYQYHITFFKVVQANIFTHYISLHIVKIGLRLWKSCQARKLP